MVKTLRGILGVLLAVQVLLPFTLAAAPAAEPPPPAPADDSLPRFAPGQLLVKFRADVGPEAVQAVLSAHGLRVRRHLAGPDLYLVEGPVGRELTLVSALQAEPAVEYAEPNYIVGLIAPQPEVLAPYTAPTAQDGARPRPSARAALPQDELVTDLHMSDSAAGPAPLEHKFPSSIPTVYVVFTYTVGTPGQPLLVEVDYLDAVTGTATVFTHTEVYTGTGTASIAIYVGDAFPDQSQFAVGHYTTTVYSTPDGGQTWEPAGSPVPWQVIIEPRDGYYKNYQWNLHNTGKQSGARTPDADIDAPEAWAITTGRSDMTIAVLSTGVDLEHPDLQAKLWVNRGEIPDNGLDDDGNGYVDDVHGYDFTDEAKPEPMAVWWTGTFMAGVAAAETDNGVGIAGASWGARIMSVKALRLFCPSPTSCQPGAYLSWIVEGIDYATDNGARVIIAGFHNLTDDLGVIEALRRAVDYAYERDVLVVTGAGDFGQASPVSYPAAFEHVMAVAGTEGDDRRTEHSSCGHWVDVAAPGANIIGTIWSADGGSGYGTVSAYDSQTVFAAAQVAGLAALVWSLDPSLEVEDVRAIIEGSADKVDATRYPYGPDGRNDCYGHGRINAEQALLTTTHVLTVTPSSLTFITDSTAEGPLCYTLTNPGTGALTWRVSTDADWLSLDGPSGRTPSQVVACADWRALPEHNTYSAVITATSTLTNHANNPMVIPVTLVYTDAVNRVYVPLIANRGQAH